MEIIGKEFGYQLCRMGNGKFAVLDEDDDTIVESFDVLERAKAFFSKCVKQSEKSELNRWYLNAV